MLKGILLKKLLFVGGLYMIKLYDGININPVTEIQFYLREISKYIDDIPLINPDGIYDSVTREAVTKFQLIKGLPQTGVVDLNTWYALVEEYNKYKGLNILPNKLECFPSEKVEIRNGDEFDIVYIIQILINSFNKKYKNYNKVNVTGKYDSETEYAIKQFQASNKLPVTGIVDKETWNSLSAINNTCRLYDL